ncbi:hypothetical protein C8R42DRAFT_637765 [Lentinula raphanica]|nr:hypothetical protein C8R42DRAFT_637765 [Lentinula raphanica]
MFPTFRTGGYGEATGGYFLIVPDPPLDLLNIEAIFAVHHPLIYNSFKTSYELKDPPGTELTLPFIPTTDINKPLTSKEMGAFLAGVAHILGPLGEKAAWKPDSFPSTLAGKKNLKEREDWDNSLYTCKSDWHNMSKRPMALFGFNFSAIIFLTQ